MGYLFFLNWKLALVYCAIAGIFFCMTRWFGGIMRTLQRTIQVRYCALLLVRTTVVVLLLLPMNVLREHIQQCILM
jgi:hypothetical protein